jgi:hypothetical protein
MPRSVVADGMPVATPLNVASMLLICSCG